MRVFQNEDGRFVASDVTPDRLRFPSRLAAADFNDDGRIDLAVSSYGVGDVSVFLAIGDGTFQPQTPIPVGAVDDGHRRRRPHRRRPCRPRHRRLDRSDGRRAPGKWRRHLSGAGSSRRPRRRPRRGRGRPDRQRHPGPDHPRREHQRGVDPAGPGRRHLPRADRRFRSGWAPGASRSATSPATASPTWPSRTASMTRVSILLGNGNGTLRARRDAGHGNRAVLHHDGRP